MNDLYLTPVGMEQRQDPYELIIPESFEEALTYEEQILWMLIHKQDLLIEGDNITLTRNEDGTVTISSEGQQVVTYRLDTTTPDAGYTAAYILINETTGEQSGVKIQVPTVAGPQGPEGPQGPAGQDGQDGQNGQDGVGIASIAFKETDASGNNIYTITLTNNQTYDITCPIGPQGETGQTGQTGQTGPAGPGVPSGGTTGQILRKSSNDNYDAEWDDLPASVGAYLRKKVNYTPDYPNIFQVVSYSHEGYVGNHSIKHCIFIETNVVLDNLDTSKSYLPAGEKLSMHGTLDVLVAIDSTHYPTSMVSIGSTQNPDQSKLDSYRAKVGNTALIPANPWLNSAQVSNNYVYTMVLENTTTGDKYKMSVYAMYSSNYRPIILTVRRVFGTYIYDESGNVATIPIGSYRFWIE